ncbi:TVP38/TMEM64 family protein [Brevibacillus choshinensis]|uniref:TVP38/TMEM64 family protein n=1 Tax=Brevibacillus choshinensis TaxID=54911 RepID=UPI002E1AD125|nr:VTT domain-containing protein [Brevibacillus choshinensis]
MDWITDVQAIAEWMRSWGAVAIAGSILLNILISITGVLPSIFLSGANSVVFGLEGGFFVSLAGEVIGAALAFILYRWGSTKIKKLQKWKESKWINMINDSSRMRQLTAIVLLRVNPMIPSGVVNFGASLTRVSLLNFMIATLIGKIPSMVFETLVGHDLVFLSENKSRLMISLLLGSLVFFLFWSRRKKEEDKV